MDPDVLDTSLAILSRHTGTYWDACMHVLWSWQLGEDEHGEPESPYVRRMRQLVMLGRYGRQQFLGLDLDRLELSDVDLAFRLTMDLVRRENMIQTATEQQ